MSVIAFTIGEESFGFNVELAAAKPLQKFLDEEKHHNLSVEQLTEVHKLAVEKVKADKAGTGKEATEKAVLKVVDQKADEQKTEKVIATAEVAAK